MNTLLIWLAQQATLIYLVCLLGALAYVFGALAARKRLSAAQFSLEREIAHQRITRSWLMAGLFVMLAAMVFIVSAFIAPLLPEELPGTPTPAAGLTVMPTPTSTLAATAELTATETLTATLTDDLPEVTPTATPFPTPLIEVPPDAFQPDCPSPNAQVVAPVAGLNVFGQVEVRGTATVNSFAYYKFEVQFPGADTPNFIAQYDAPIENGILGLWDVSDPMSYPPGGPYRFRLVVVDVFGNTSTCVIPVNIGTP